MFETFKVNSTGRAKVSTDRWIHSQVAIAALLWFNSINSSDKFELSDMFVVVDKDKEYNLQCG